MPAGGKPYGKGGKMPMAPRNPPKPTGKKKPKGKS